MTLPAIGWTTVELRWNFTNVDGSFPTGYIEIAPYVNRFTVTTGAGTQVIAGKPLVAKLVGGIASITVPASDDPDVVPNNFAYQISEHLDGQRELNYFIEVPQSAAQTGIDVSQVAPMALSAGVPVSLVTRREFDQLKAQVQAGGGTGGTGGTGTSAVDSVQGKVGAVTLVQDDVPSGTTAKQFTAALQTKLAGIATGATANSSDSVLTNRANHTGTQPSSSVSDFATTVQTVVNTMLVAGSGVTLSYNPTTQKLTVTSTGGTGSGTDPEVVRDTVAQALRGINGIAVNAATGDDAADTITLSISGVTVAQVNGLEARLTALETGGPSLSLNNLSDVDTSQKQQGYTLLWDSDAEHYISGPLNLSLYDPDARYVQKSEMANAQQIWVKTSGTDVPPTDFPADGVVIDATVDPAPLTQPVNTVNTSGSALTLPAPAVASIHDVTLTANCSLTFPTPVPGQRFSLLLRQDNTGVSRTVTWPTTVKWPTTGAPTLETASNNEDYFQFVCIAGQKWRLATPVLKYSGGQIIGPAPTVSTTFGASTPATTVGESSRALVLPATIAANQVCHIAVGLTSSTVNLDETQFTNAGFAKISGPDGTTAQRAWLFAKTMTGSEDGTTITITTDANSRINAVGILWNNASRSGEVLSLPQVDTTVDDVLDVPAVTPSVGNSTLCHIAICRYNGQATTTTPLGVTPTSGWTERFDQTEGRTDLTAFQIGRFVQTKALAGQGNIEQGVATAAYPTGLNVADIGWVIAVPPVVT